jgi:hypothetical protein
MQGVVGLLCKGQQGDSVEKFSLPGNLSQRRGTGGIETVSRSYKRRKYMNHWLNLCPWIWYTYGFYHISEGMNRKEWQKLFGEKITWSIS